jgi:hypothetical protein
LAILILSAWSVIAQEITKPTIGNITVVPSEPIAPGTCTSSSAGYLEESGGRTKLTDREIGQTISAALKGGYVVTVYPPTERGIFVFYECPAGSAESKAP